MKREEVAHLEAQACKFKKPAGCYILNVICCCENCAFRKTQKQYDEDVLRAERILAAKGLERVFKTTRDGVIVTVKKKRPIGRL